MKTARNFIVVLMLACSLSAHAETPVQKWAAEIDAILETHWKSESLTGNAAISDEVFLRRIFLDLAGRIPTTSEAAAFLQSTQPGRRAALIDKLLQQESYVSHFYNVWSDILRYKSQYINRAGIVEAAYGKFIKESLRANKPYDQFVREMLSAKGHAWDNGAVGYYLRDPEMPLDNMALTSRVFLGTRIECAQCHDHPFDKWTQTQFYRLAAYTFGNKSNNEAFHGARNATRAREEIILADFQREKAASSDAGKAAEKRKNERLAAMENRKIIGIIKSCVGQLFSPVGLDRDVGSVLKLPHDFNEADGKPFEVMKPATLMGDAAAVAPGQDPADVFARWLTSPSNPRFTRIITNRLWKKMFGVALTEPFDELRDDSKAMVPALESYLEKRMVELRYDMRAFLSIIANTRAYQSAVTREECARGKIYHFQGPVLRRMTAEQIWDSMIALANYEPDARDLKREAREERRINVSKMAYEAYTNFDGIKLVDMAYASLQAEIKMEERENVLRDAIVAAKRNGEKEKGIELNRQLGAISRERGESLVQNFILPILTELAQKKGGKDAVPVADPNYVMNGNPRNLPTETWRKMYIPGYGPAPKSAAQVDAEAKAETQRFVDLAPKLGQPEKDHAAFVTYCEKAKSEWLRASELDSPAPRGHFLRTMGQSDRDFVENANASASIPQALLLMNNDIISEKGLLSRCSPLMVRVNQAQTLGEKVDAAYFAVLTRKPTADEKARVLAGGSVTIEDLLYALLNTKQFIFIQ